jgi:Helix-turn-helix domain
MPDVNDLGDLEIRDPQAMRALADLTRLTLFEYLQRHGSATTEELAAEAGTGLAEVDEHLRRLEPFGLVVQGHDSWRAAAKGMQFEPADDPESQAAYRLLANEMFRRADALPSRWLEDHEPNLEPEWRRISGMSGARMLLTRDEAADLDAKMEALLTQYVTREAPDAPQDARPVRLLRYLMPESPS